MTECINTIAKLKELTLETISKLPKELTPETTPCVTVQGYHEPGDGGGGTFFWDSAFNVDLTKFPDGEDFGTIIKPNFIDTPSKLGRWRREFTGPVDIRWFGASTTIDDNSDAIQRAIDTGQPVYIPYSGPNAFKFAKRLKLWPGTVISGGGRMTSIIEFTGCGIAIDDIDYGPATRSILYGFKLQASGDGVSAIGIQMTNAKIVVLENLWIEGADSLGSQHAHWSIAGLSIRGGQGTNQNTYGYRIWGCDISGCKGDGILVKDDGGTGGLYVFHSRIQGCGGIGFSQEFGSDGPGHKCQVYVEGNDIEGNSGGQVNCDSLCGSTFKNNHLENQGVPKDSTVIPVPNAIPPMSFGYRRVPKASSGTTTGKNTHFKITERSTLTLSIDGGKDIKIPFETGDMKLSDIMSKINGATVPMLIASDSGGRLKLTSTNILDLKRKPELGGPLTEVELQTSRVVVSGSSCLLANLGLTAGIYNAHYDWNGQFFGLNITGNNINCVSANWAIEFPSTSGSIGIIVQGNLISGSNDALSKANRKQPVAAIVSRPQHNIAISGNSCRGAFDVEAGGEEYANYEEPYSFTGPYSLYGQDTEGHQLLGDLRFGITKVTKTVIIDEHSPKSIQDYDRYYGRSYSFHIKADNPVSFPLPAHKVGKRVLFKNIGLAAATIISRKGTIDGMPSYTLPQYSFVELEDDGINYWIVGSGRGGSSLVEGAPP